MPRRGGRYLRLVHPETTQQSASDPPSVHERSGRILAYEGLVGCQGDVLDGSYGLPLGVTFAEDDNVVLLTLAPPIGEHYPGVREGALVGSDLVGDTGFFGQRPGQPFSKVVSVMRSSISAESRGLV